MKRLTGRAPDGTAYLYNMGGTNAAIDRLAAYEDTGLEPEEIRMIQQIKEFDEDVERETDYALRQLEKYTKAEREGLLLVLPEEVTQDD